jgi:predicted nucleic acid-binding protein
VKLFIDTNVIIDFLRPTRQKHKVAIALFDYLVKAKHQIVISEDMITTIFYLSKTEKLQALRFLKSIQDKWLVLPFGKKTINQALDLSLEKNLDLEDTLQCLCAKNNQCDVLITNDISFYNCEIKIQTASEFLNA